MQRFATTCRSPVLLSLVAITSPLLRFRDEIQACSSMWAALCRDFHDSEAGTSRGHFATSSTQAQPVRQSSEPLSPATTSDLVSTKKLGLMHRLLAKAKAHKGDPHKSSSHNLEPQQDQADLFRKSDTRHVQIAEESKENYPAHPILPQPSAQQQQDRSFMSSSLPTTPAGESAVPSIARRSVVSEDHHLKAFESSAPGHLALSIAPQLSEVKGRLSNLLIWEILAHIFWTFHPYALKCKSNTSASR